jgi:glycosyltransferase involved in cell wall biosynthesis
VFVKISFAICTHNEGEYYIGGLLGKITAWLDLHSTVSDPHHYEIVIIDDYSTNPETIATLEKYALRPDVLIFQHALDGDFSTHKNFMNSKCTGDWILNLDADEWVLDSFADIIPLIIEANPDVEAYWLPRINTVSGLTLDHVRKWGWIITTMVGHRRASDSLSSGEYDLLKAYNLIVQEVDGYVIYDQPIINWPDLQMRLYRNESRIHWENIVHEKLTGFNHFTMMPIKEEYAIRHFKEIERQEQQNTYYDTLG